MPKFTNASSINIGYCTFGEEHFSYICFIEYDREENSLQFLFFLLILFLISFKLSFQGELSDCRNNYCT